MTHPRPQATDAARPALRVLAEPEPDDAALVVAAQADPHAFAPLYARYVGPVYRYCAARLDSREAAEDATAEVFAHVLAALARYRDGSFAAWLFRIAHNVVADLHRRRAPAAPVAAPATRPTPAAPPRRRRWPAPSGRRSGRRWRPCPTISARRSSCNCSVGPTSGLPARSARAPPPCGCCATARTAGSACC